MRVSAEEKQRQYEHALGLAVSDRMGGGGAWQSTLNQQGYGGGGGGGGIIGQRGPQLDDWFEEVAYIGPSGKLCG